MLTQQLEEHGRLAGLQPVGILDIGSNSIRLVVYEGAVRAATPLFNEKVLCGLGRPVAATGRIGKEASDRALAALRRFRAISDRLGVSELRAIATAAVRDASDGSVFINKCEKVIGVSIEILSGEREATLAARGIMMGFLEPDGIVGDLGGGSLELVDIAGEDIKHGKTLPLGGLRLQERSGGSLSKARTIIDEKLSSVSWLKHGKKRPFYAVGGTWRAFAKMNMALSDYPLRVMQGYSIDTDAALVLAESLRKGDKTIIAALENVSKARREVMPFGALVLERLIAKIEPSEIVFSIHGVREGLLLEIMPEEERRKDPLLSFCVDYARLRSRSLQHSEELCDWTDQLFESPGPTETPEEARLRHAACLLSDVGWRAHPDYRGEQSLNVIAHAGLSGIDHPGRLFLAMAIYFRHAGQGADAGQHLSQRLQKSVNARSIKRARITGAAIRAAHILSVGTPGIVPYTALSYEDETLVLDIPSRFSSLDGERLRRRFHTLATVLDRKSEIRFG